MFRQARRDTGPTLCRSPAKASRQLQCPGRRKKRAGAHTYCAPRNSILTIPLYPNLEKTRKKNVRVLASAARRHAPPFTRRARGGLGSILCCPPTPATPTRSASEGVKPFLPCASEKRGLAPVPVLFQHQVRTGVPTLINRSGRRRRPGLIHRFRRFPQIKKVRLGGVSI